ncbi:YbaB/EbfC family nucleoid-associated protein [Rhodococcus sp. IEGM 1379]|uniref:YbaB/EbfC family nucleoid-associated protein n=1 Tax=Rhodococcus sp. IEGM 1379 TaxID=3047086 RepID=UPI0024B7FB22|nr:YbaB/EbfC family nucleoid-associated protein [Rhodococcus sp. IEGM 1379]MDI9916467.1 YbaB/EbfC family nucleoid-associated protein [Rhodococcus sp. IEGM 1379]
MNTAEMDSVRGRSEVLRGQIDSMMEDLRTRTTRLATAQEAIATSTAQARSADGSVEIVVNASGAVVGVKFSADAFSRTTPRKLAAAVLATAGLAEADMRRQNAEILRPFTTAAQVDLPDLIPGAPSLRDVSPVVAVDDGASWNRSVLRSARNA